MRALGFALVIVCSSACSSDVCTVAMGHQLCFDSRDFSLQTIHDGSVEFSSSGDSLENVSIRVLSGINPSDIFGEYAHYELFHLERSCSNGKLEARFYVAAGDRNLLNAILSSENEMISITSVDPAKIDRVLLTVSEQLNVARPMCFGDMEKVSVPLAVELASVVSVGGNLD